MEWLSSDTSRLVRPLPGSPPSISSTKARTRPASPPLWPSAASTENTCSGCPNCRSVISPANRSAVSSPAVPMNFAKRVLCWVKPVMVKPRVLPSLISTFTTW